MERHFVLPLTIAAAAHVGLLFGIPGGPAEITPGNHHNDIEKSPIPFIEVFVAAPPEADTPAPIQGKIIDPAPTPPEPPPPIEHAGDFKIVVPPREPTTAKDIWKIPDGPVGLPEGLVDGTLMKPGVGFRSTDLDAPPHARVQGAPVYPFEAKRDSLTGEVLVEFTVDESGAVVSPHVVRSSDRIFEEATLRAVSRWRFEPGKRAGQVVRFRMAVPVVFNLNET